MGAQAVSLAVSTLLFITFTCCTDWQLMALADTEYVVINNALNESGGQKFESEVGETKAQSILTSATQFIRNTFGYDAGNPSKVVDKVTLYVDDEPTQGVVAFTSSDVSGTPNAYEIHYSQNYVDSLNGVEGVLYHEMTHVWQWNGQGTADGGLIESIADYVRLTAGLPASGWGQPSEGNKWDDG
ncbi:hypothetical protein KP509_25G016200 [Ceratopteris richardii]|uniref:Uncharacterized protein n=1 Tax=Ceratopteris richardii TaxID=49495 RepID=A0A8T2RMY9_CERRI|nr:hypothetical protein KP509_25G016200 [Ceratopteris richardii]